MRNRDILKNILINELTLPVTSDVVDFADVLAQTCPELPVGILFYGSALRKYDSESILDFYIIVENERNFRGNCLSKVGNMVLPPNVHYVEYKSASDTVWRAKIAVISVEQFRNRSMLASLDSSIWARFCQPVRLIWVRDENSADTILELIIKCVTTAACWAALLMPKKALPVEFWKNLFAKTYDSELRVEKKGRGNSLISGQESRFVKLLTLGWLDAGLTFSKDQNNRLRPEILPSIRLKAQKRWKLIKKTGKLRNIARLIKAAFTFDNGGSYLAWKIKRHTGIDLKLTKFEADHPLLMLPILLCRMNKLRKKQ